jgi:hypothetical protein
LLATPASISVLVGLPAASAAAGMYSNSGAITIPSTGVASPYPSTISIPNLGGPVSDVNVTLTGFGGSNPSHLQVLVVGPTGKDVELMDDIFATASVSGLNLTFDDSASTSIVSATTLTSGTYQPGHHSDFAGPPPAPMPPSGTALSEFNGTDPTGTWSLFVYTTQPSGGGSIAGGWSLDIKTRALTSFSPDHGKAGDPVVLTGTGFTGATAVTFGGKPATTFTVDSDTQITAKVPRGARTGPISVTSPAGTVTSTTRFVVDHQRSALLSMNGATGRGSVEVDDGFRRCGATVPVTVQHLVAGHWRTVAALLTKANGSFLAHGLRAPGSYRAVARRVTLPSKDVCLKDISPVTSK